MKEKIKNYLLPRLGKIIFLISIFIVSVIILGELINSYDGTEEFFASLAITYIIYYYGRKS